MSSKWVLLTIGNVRRRYYSSPFLSLARIEALGTTSLKPMMKRHKTDPPGTNPI